jgi:hypothetical protein
MKKNQGISKVNLTTSKFATKNSIKLKKEIYGEFFFLREPFRRL